MLSKQIDEVMDAEEGDKFTRNSQLLLKEDDVPGAALNGREPATLTIPQLQCWLKCRDAPTKGKKADLVAR